MKAPLCLLLALVFLLSLCPLAALADNGPTISTLFDPGISSETGELGGHWAPTSLDDDPYKESYDEPATETVAEEMAAAETEAGGETAPSEEIPAEEAVFALEPEADGLEPDSYVPNYLDGSCYDPRAMGGITLPIRDQGSLPTCWSMSAISCAELGGLKEGLLSGTPNLSEWHLEYFSRKGFPDPLDNVGGDHLVDGLFSGGNPYLSVMTLASWTGPADETKTNTPYENISDIVLDHSLALSSELHLENAYWLSMQGAEDWAILKEQIRSRGAAVLCFNINLSNFSYDYNSYYCSSNTLGTNHEVAVVGWDDNFPAENFTQAAPGKGAWLCRNSSGTGFGDGGYFWLSYYDGVLRRSVAAAFDFASTDNYDNNYQYDGCAVQAYIHANSSQSYANIFTAKANPGGYEELQAISTYSYSPGVAYSYEIYCSLSYETEPDSGRLAAEGSGVFPYAGYHSIALPSPVKLYEGESFSVIFTIETNAEGGSDVPTCSTQPNWSSVNESEAGQSFLWWQNDWYDLSDPRGGSSGSNVRIKAFTENKSGSVTLHMDARGGSLSADSLSVVWGQAPGASVADPVRPGYSFQGWETESGAYFDPADRLFENTGIRAQWLRNWNDPFEDVRSEHWYYGNVRYCYQHDLILGMTESLFGSGDNSTRAQIITMLYRLAGEPASSAALPFDDVPAEAYFAPAVRWAAEAGIVLGFDDNGDGIPSFSPFRHISRQDFLLMLYRFAQWQGADTGAYENTDLSSFQDHSDIAAYALPAEKWSVGCGLQLGSEGHLNPQTAILRSEVAGILSRFDGYESE